MFTQAQKQQQQEDETMTITLTTEYTHRLDLIEPMPGATPLQQAPIVLDLDPEDGDVSIHVDYEPESTPIDVHEGRRLRWTIGTADGGTHWPIVDATQLADWVANLAPLLTRICTLHNAGHDYTWLSDRLNQALAEAPALSTRGAGLHDAREWLSDLGGHREIGAEYGITADVSDEAIERIASEIDRDAVNMDAKVIGIEDYLCEIIDDLRMDDADEN